MTLSSRIPLLPLARILRWWIVFIVPCAVCHGLTPAVFAADSPVPCGAAALAGDLDPVVHDDPGEVQAVVIAVDALSGQAVVQCSGSYFTVNTQMLPGAGPGKRVTLPISALVGGSPGPWPITVHPSKQYYLESVQGRFGTDYSRQDLDFLLKRLDASPLETVAIHFHGGLVDRDMGLQEAANLEAIYSNSPAYPVFFIWNSGPFTAAQSHRKAYDTSVPSLVLEILRHFGELSRLKSALMKTAAVLTCADSPVTAPGSSPSNPMPQDPFGQNSKLNKIYNQVLARVIARCADGRNHGADATVTEELLRAVGKPTLADVLYRWWQNMKDGMAAAFEPGGAGAAFVDGLGRSLQRHPRRIVLVAHSAGAIYLCRFLAYADAHLPADVRFDVVLWAPAADFHLFACTIRNHGRRIAHIRVFALEDHLEREARLDLGHFSPYPASILYLVSGVNECPSDTTLGAPRGPAAVCEAPCKPLEVGDRPLIGLQRDYRVGTPEHYRVTPEWDAERTRLGWQYDTDPDVRTVREFLQGNIVWSDGDPGTCGIPGWECEAKLHTGFDDDPATLRSLLYILRYGFYPGGEPGGLP